MSAQLSYRVEGDQLIITANNTARAEIKGGFEQNGYQGAESVMCDLGFNGANGGLSFLPPERIPDAMTDMPLLAEWVTEDDGSTSIWGKVWGFTDYCITDPWERLKDTGRVRFELVADYGKDGAHMPDPYSKAAQAINAESYDKCLTNWQPSYPPALIDNPYYRASRGW